MNHRLLMCEPQHFNVNYSINPWMDDNIGKCDNSLAYKQWETLYNALAKVADIQLITPVKDLPDMVFTANAGLLVGNNFFLSRFNYNERKNEESFFKDWAVKNQFDIIDSDWSFEGEGDCLVDSSDTYWMGYGFRTDKNYINVMWDFDIKSKVANLVDNRFYHIDTCFCPLPDGSIMYYPGAFSPETQRDIDTHFRGFKKIKVSEQEALAFCCNSVVLDDKIFMPQCPSIADQLIDLGWDVQQFDMSEFLKSGGACKCLTMHMTR